MSERKYVLTASAAQQKLKRMSLEIAESLSGQTGELYLLGIQQSGMIIAEEMAKLLGGLLNKNIRTIAVQLNKQMPTDVVLSEQVDLNGSNIVLIDDVTNSGKTLLYALKPLLEAHPRSIQTLVLVERMHKQFPVKPDFVGLSIATTQEEHIQVETAGGSILGAFVL